MIWSYTLELPNWIRLIHVTATCAMLLSTIALNSSEAILESTEKANLKGYHAQCWMKRESSITKLMSFLYYSKLTYLSVKLSAAFIQWLNLTEWTSDIASYMHHKNFNLWISCSRSAWREGASNTKYIDAREQCLKWFYLIPCLKAL